MFVACLSEAADMATLDMRVGDDEVIARVIAIDKARFSASKPCHSNRGMLHDFTKQLNIAGQYIMCSNPSGVCSPDFCACTWNQ